MSLKVSENQTELLEIQIEKDETEPVVERVKPIAFLGAYSLIVGCIIGSGIFITVQDSFKVFTNSIYMILALWATGGLVSLIGGFNYATLGTLYPESGGESTYLRKAYGAPLGICFTYIYAFFTKTLAMAVLAITMGVYFSKIINPNPYKEEKIVERSAAAFILICLFFLNVFSKVWAARIQIVFTVLKIISVIIIIISGIVFIAKGNLQNLKAAQKIEKFNYKEIGSGFIGILWAYDGWNILGSVAGEIRNPRRNIPLSLFTGILTVTCLYCGTIFSYVAVIGYDNILKDSTPIGTAFGKIMFGKATFIINVIVCISTIGAINGTFIGASRIIMTSSYRRDIPLVLGLVTSKRRTPLVACLIMLCFSCLFLSFDFKELLNYCTCATWIFYLLAISTIIYFKRRGLNSFSSVLRYCVLPIIMMLISLSVVVATFIKSYIGCSVVVGIAVVIVGIQYLILKFPLPKGIIKAHDSIKIILCRFLSLDEPRDYDVS